MSRPDRHIHRAASKGDGHGAAAHNSEIPSGPDGDAVPWVAARSAARRAVGSGAQRRRPRLQGMGVSALPLRQAPARRQINGVELSKPKPDSRRVHGGSQVIAGAGAGRARFGGLPHISFSPVDGISARSTHPGARLPEDAKFDDAGEASGERARTRDFGEQGLGFITHGVADRGWAGVFTRGVPGRGAGGRANGETLWVKHDGPGRRERLDHVHGDGQDPSSARDQAAGPGHRRL